MGRAGVSRRGPGFNPGMGKGGEGRGEEGQKERGGEEREGMSWVFTLP